MNVLRLERLRWRNLSIRGKLTLVFGMQLILVAVLGLTSFLAQRSVQRQREILLEAQRLESLTNDLELGFVEAHGVQNDFLFAWEKVGYYPAAVEQAKFAHAVEIEDIRETTDEIETLLEDSTLPGAARARRDVQTLRAVADFYEGRFLETVDTLGQLAAEDVGAFDQLSDQGAALTLSGTSTWDTEILGSIFTILDRAQAFQATSNPEYLSLLHTEVEHLEGLLANADPPETAEERLATQAALDAYMVRVGTVEELSTDFSEQVEALDAVIGEAEPIWVEVSWLASQEAAEAAAAAERVTRLVNLVLGVGIGLTVVLGGAITYLLWRSFTTRLVGLTDAALRLEGGDLSTRAEVVGGDEFGRLASTFNAMAVQLQGVVSGLEARAVARARDLETIAEISRSITSLHAPRELLREVVELVRDRFGFYHAQVFLIDEEGEYAVLRESTGEAGRMLLAQQHRLAVGSRSVIGQVTAHGEPVIALDTDVDPVHRRNELLPDTRSEMALPLRIGDEVMGALDVQSVEADAFDEEDVAVFQTMADQLAIALQNAQLFAEARAAVGEIERLNRRLIGQAWDRFTARRGPDVPHAYRIEGTDVLPGAEGLPPEVLDKLGDRALVELDGEGGDDLRVAVPIRVRGEVIGAFGFGGEELESLSEEDIALVEAVAERVGVALENVRLFEQTQQQAHREQLVNQITSKIVGSTDVDDILQITARELGRVLRSPETRIQLRGDRDDE